MKQIKVTEEFLQLDKRIINCQNEEALHDCMTRLHVDEVQNQCNCTPYAMRNFTIIDQV